MMGTSKPLEMNQVLPALVNKHLREARFCIPAIVEAYDSDKRLVDVTPLVSFLTLGNQEIKLPKINKVPYAFIGGGNFCIDIDLKKGDNVLLLFSDYGIGNWRYSDGKNQVKPDDINSHELQNAIVILGLHTDANSIKNVSKLKVDATFSLRRFVYSRRSIIS